MTTNFERGFNDTIAAGGGLAGAGIGAAAGGLLGLLTNRKNRLRGALAGLLGGGAIGYGLGAHTNYLANKIKADRQDRERSALQSRKMLSLPYGALRAIAFRDEDLATLFAAHPELEQPYRAAKAMDEDLVYKKNRLYDARKESIRSNLIEKYKKDLVEHEKNRPTNLSTVYVDPRSGEKRHFEARFTPDGKIESRIGFYGYDGGLNWIDWDSNTARLWPNPELKKWVDTRDDLRSKSEGDLGAIWATDHKYDAYDPDSADYWDTVSLLNNNDESPLSAFVE